MYSRGVSYNERILADALADGDMHENAAAVTDICTILLIFQGIFLRFDIATNLKLTIFQIVDVTMARWVHTALGILAWVGARIAVLTGTAIHGITFGSTLFVFVVVETVIAVILHFALEVVYRVMRYKNRAALATKAQPTDEQQRIL